MSVSLYAVGTADIEVGKYGMNLIDANLAFSETLAKHGIVPKNVKEEKDSVVFHLPFSDKNHDLLHDVAKVEDLHGDPPNVYILSEQHVPHGEYIKTGSYND